MLWGLGHILAVPGVVLIECSASFLQEGEEHQCHFRSKCLAKNSYFNDAICRHCFSDTYTSQLSHLATVAHSEGLVKGPSVVHVEGLLGLGPDLLPPSTGPRAQAQCHKVCGRNQADPRKGTSSRHFQTSMEAQGWEVVLPVQARGGRELTELLACVH